MEELKLILESLNTMSENVFLFAMVWLAKEFIIDFLVVGVLGGLVFGLYKTVKNLINSCIIESVIAREIGTTAPLSDREKEQVITLIRRGMDKC